MINSKDKYYRSSNVKFILLMREKKPSAWKGRQEVSSILENIQIHIGMMCWNEVVRTMILNRYLEVRFEELQSVSAPYHDV